MDGRLIELKLSTLLNKFGQGAHKPGSGSAAALEGLLACHLLVTVVVLTDDPKRQGHYQDTLPRLRQIKSDIAGRIIPRLESLFQTDSEQFDAVFKLRTMRDNEEDPLKKQYLNDEALAALKNATDTPLAIANECLIVAKYAVEVFDGGFRSARGDSQVALNAATAAVAGCLSIIDLNLLSFRTNSWTTQVRASRDEIYQASVDLSQKAHRRMIEQRTRVEENNQFWRRIDELRSVAKGRSSLPVSLIEDIAMDLQRAIWKRDVNKHGRRNISPFRVLNPENALRYCGFHVHVPDTLGQHRIDGKLVEVAGQIDQREMLVSLSRQFPKEVRNFTAAHELGHSLLHAQRVLHRDRPLDGSDTAMRRSQSEWQADKFATFFLMPAKLVRQSFQELFLTDCFQITDETAFALGKDDVQKLRRECKDRHGLARLLATATMYNGVPFRPLSQQFHVSTKAFAIRLEELNLVDF